jgi:hypothetical protein
MSFGHFCLFLLEYALLCQQVDHLQVIFTQTRHVPSDSLNSLTEARVKLLLTSLLIRAFLYPLHSPKLREQLALRQIRLLSKPFLFISPQPGKSLPEYLTGNLFEFVLVVEFVDDPECLRLLYLGRKVLLSSEKALVITTTITEMVSAPQIEHRAPITRPTIVWGDKSPKPSVVIVIMVIHAMLLYTVPAELELYTSAYETLNAKVKTTTLKEKMMAMNCAGASLKMHLMTLMAPEVTLNSLRMRVALGCM